MSVCVCLHACEAATFGSVILEVVQQSFQFVQRHLFTVSLYLMFWQPLQTAQALGPSGSRMFVAWFVFSLFWYASWRSVDPATIRPYSISLELVATVAPALPVHVTRPFRTMRGYDLVADLTNAL